MRLLITGGAGSLGSNIIEHLGDRCESILVIDNFATGKAAALLPRDNLRIVEGSVEDEEFLNAEFSRFGPTHVIHSAASYKDPNDWVRDASVNVIGTINVVRATELSGASRLVNFQTALCYGRPSKVPIPVEHPKRPFTSYGISKSAGEDYVQTSSVPWVSLRLANVTGPRLAIGPIPTFYKRLKAGEGCSVSTTVRDFLDMSDFLSLLDAVLEDSARGTFNVSTGEGHTIQEIFETVASYLGRPDTKPQAVNEPSADDVAAVVLDPSLTESVFGWRARVSFDETLVRVLRWYDDNGVTDIYSHLLEKK
jgi:UDP-glucose 4-epimerase